MQIRLGKVVKWHPFYVTQKLKHSLLLGADFLRQSQAILNCSENSLEIGLEKITLVDSDHIGSLCRLAKNVRIPPQTAVSVKIRKTPSAPDLGDEQVYEITALKTGILDNEPGLTVINGITSSPSHVIPAVILNMTGKTFHLTRGSVLAKIQTVNLSEIRPVQTPSEGAGSYMPPHHGNQEINDKYVETVSQSGSQNDQQGRRVSDIRGKWRKPQHGEPVKFDQVNIGDPNTTFREKQQLLNLLTEFHEVFSKYEYDIGRTHLMEVEIKTGNSPPIKIPPYRTPSAIRPEMARQIKEMLAAGIISESQSPWSCPLFAVPKKGNKIRFVVNYDPLNKVSEKFYWPLTQIDQILSTLAGTMYFTSLDISNAFHQIPLKVEDRPKSAFVCSEGLYEYNTLAFGLTNAPSIFTQLMDRILNGIKNTFVTSYADDILIYSKTVHEHMKHIRIVLERIREAGIKLNKGKCEFFKTELEFLGHVVTREGIKPQESKIQAIQNTPIPTTVKKIRSYLGLCGYYRRYIHRFSEIARPLTSLTKKHAQFHWTPECQRAFDMLKSKITSPPVLIHPDPNRSFTLWTDASTTGLGGVLCQVDDHGCHRPIHFLSAKFTTAQRKWSTYEREFYAIVKSLSVFRPILYGRPFTIFTDHAPLTYVKGSQHTNPKVQRWAMTVAQYGCDIQYVPGRHNAVSDFLSRIGEPDSKLSIREFPLTKPIYNPHPDRLVEIEPDLEEDMEVEVIDTSQMTSHPPCQEKYSASDASEQDDTEYANSPSLPKPPINIRYWGPIQQQDVKLRHIINQLNQGDTCPEPIRKKYAVIDGRLRRFDKNKQVRLVVPLSMQADLLEQAHTGFLGGHLGFRKMYTRLKRWYFWSGMFRDCLVHCDECIPCNMANLTARPIPIEENPVPKFPFHTISVDTYGPLPESHSGNSYIVTAIDQLTGWPECCAVPDKSAPTICRFLLSDIIARHSVPIVMMSDNGTEFVNGLIKELSRTLNMVHIRCANYSPQANGKCERIHRDYTAYFRKMANHDKLNWDQHLTSILGAYRCAEHASAGASPFFLLYGRDPLYPVDTLLKPRLTYHGEDPVQLSLESMHRAWRVARSNLRHRAAQNRERHNRNIRPEQLKVGDPVYIKNNRPTDKFDSRFLPHGRITAQTGPHNFRVKELISGDTCRLNARNLRKAAETPGWGINRPLPRLTDRRVKYVYADSDDESTAQSSSEGDDIDMPVKHTNLGDQARAGRPTCYQTPPATTHPGKYRPGSTSTISAKNRTNPKNSFTPRPNSAKPTVPTPPIRRSARLATKPRKQS